MRPKITAVRTGLESECRTTAATCANKIEGTYKLGNVPCFLLQACSEDGWTGKTFICSHSTKYMDD
jgi:hypothetical protein